MRNKKVLIFALVASLALNVSMLAAAGYRAYRHAGQWVSPFGTVMTPHRFLFEELSLSSVQLKALRERTIPFRAEIDRRRREMIEKRRVLVALMRSERPDKKTIDATVGQISRMQEEMQRRITNHMLEVKGSLSPEDQRKFLDLIERTMSAGAAGGCPPDAHEPGRAGQ